MDRSSRPQKRRRVLVACSSCRARKTKCDAKKPTCSTCLSVGDVCDYTAEGVHTNTKVLVDKELVIHIPVAITEVDRFEQISPIYRAKVGAY
jgi:hypothetical protein